MIDFNVLWQSILSELETIYSEDTFQEVFEPLTSIHHEDHGVLFIIVPNAFIKNRIQRLYVNTIQDISKKLYAEPLRFKFILADDSPLSSRRWPCDWKTSTTSILHRSP